MMVGKLLDWNSFFFLLGNEVIQILQGTGHSGNVHGDRIQSSGLGRCFAFSCAFFSWVLRNEKYVIAS